jgi:arylsulfatase A-like enzyme
MLLALPVLAIVLAALDAALVRWAEPWRPADVGLFFHTYFLWALFGLLAWGPARWTLRVWDRGTGAQRPRVHDARPWVCLLAWMVLPVLAQAALDEHTTLVGFAGLAEPGPWLELGGSLCLGALLVIGVGRLLSGIPGARSASIGVALAYAVGLFLPANSGARENAPAALRPNLLLLVWDTCRSDKLEPYGFERATTPGLEALAGESLVFEDSLSVSTFTFTSHLSLLSGVHPLTHGARMLDMHVDPARVSTIAERLRAAGYRTGGFVGTDVLSGRTGIHTGFDVYDDAVDPAVCATFAWSFVHALQSLAAAACPVLRQNGRPHWIQDFQRPASEVLERARAWITRVDPRPWFCFVNLYDAHWPYLPEGDGARLVSPYGGPVDGFLFRSDRWQAGYRMTAGDRAHVNELYEGELFDLDREVTRFLGALELERGGTAVLMTSDHGEGLGEGDTWNHDDVRESQVRVPLILRLPQPNPRGERVKDPVSGVDVAPTLLALAGLGVPAEMEGRSLLAPNPSPRARWVDDRDHVHAEDYRAVLYEGHYKLVRFGTGASARFELYDLTRDPAGLTDIRSAEPEVFANMRSRLERRVGTQASVTGALDASTASGLEALGYAGN